MKPFKYKAFASHQTLKGNIGTDTKEKPYEFNECGNPLQNSFISKYIKTHSGKKLYECNELGKVFAYQTHLESMKEQILEIGRIVCKNLFLRFMLGPHIEF